MHRKRSDIKLSKQSKIPPLHCSAASRYQNGAQIFYCISLELLVYASHTVFTLESVCGPKVLPSLQPCWYHEDLSPISNHWGRDWQAQMKYSLLGALLWRLTTFTMIRCTWQLFVYVIDIITSNRRTTLLSVPQLSMAFSMSLTIFTIVHPVGLPEHFT